MAYRKSICAAVTAAAMLQCCFSASAEVLGDKTAETSWVTNMGGGAGYYHNVFNSASVGNQTENYVEYTPNSEAVPVVVNGSSVWGTRTILSASDYMTNNGMRPLIGINADFFSFSTGIPMGYTVIDGKIFSKESNTQDAVGFCEDGTAFIDKIGISSSLSYDNETIEVRYINKWLQNGFDCVNLLTDDFSSSSHTDFKALYVTCSADSGDLSLNSTMSLTVDEIYEYDGSIKLPKNKYVFVMDVDGDADCYRMLSQLRPGDKLSFRSTVWGAERHDWSQAKYIVSSIGGRLLNNGVLGSGFEAGSAPRTAVGIKADGSVIFYTIDGRQSGYSYGCQISTLAKRMQELGCVDAVNFDGGGSTVMGATFPGHEVFEIRSRPSEGSVRSCANYIFLQDKREQSGIPWYVQWQEPSSGNYLAGSSLQLKASSVYDTGNYKMDGLPDAEWSVENSGTAQTEVDGNGYISFKGEGKSVVKLDCRGYTHSFNFEVYQSPDKIVVRDAVSGNEIDKISLYNDEMKNIMLEAAAYKNGELLVSTPDLFKWSCDGSLAQVDESGHASLKYDGTSVGSIIAAVGDAQKIIPIELIKRDVFSDISGHWAHDVIMDMADSGIINGIEENGGIYFKPDSNITRIQFAAIMCNALGLNPSEYSGIDLEYTDADKIQPWAVDYVKAMTEQGYITGRSDDDGITQYFDPESSITRAEAFTIMSRCIDMVDETMLTYTDKSDIPLWSVPAFRKLAALGIIEGFEDNSIHPNERTTRAEAAAMVSKLLKIM